MLAHDSNMVLVLQVVVPFVTEGPLSHVHLCQPDFRIPALALRVLPGDHSNPLDAHAQPPNGAGANPALAHCPPDHAPLGVSYA